MKAGSLVIKVYEIEMLEEDMLTLTPEEDGVQVKLVNTTIPSQPNEYISIYFWYFQIWKNRFKKEKIKEKQAITASNTAFFRGMPCFFTLHFCLEMAVTQRG